VEPTYILVETINSNCLKCEMTFREK